MALTAVHPVKLTLKTTYLTHTMEEVENFCTPFT